MTYKQVVDLADALRARAAKGAKSVEEFAAPGLPVAVPVKTVREMVLQLGLQFVKPTAAPDADWKLRRLEERIDAGIEIDKRIRAGIESRLDALEKTTALRRAF